MSILDNNPFSNSLKLMTSQHELVTRNLVNLIEMISTSSHRYAENTRTLSEEAVKLMQAASATKDIQSLGELQRQWTEAVMSYSKDQTNTGMSFLENCGKQAISLASTLRPEPVQDGPEGQEDATPNQTEEGAHDQSQP